jgi:polysaccharide export outer membrane protein
MAPVRVARAFRLPIIAAMTALALSGCMSTSGPVAVAQPQGDLDSIAYGQPYYPASPGYVSSPSGVADSGGAIAALRASFASTSQRSYAPVPVGYAAAPAPVAYDTAYRLDAGDKLRIVVYGQEGLTNIRDPSVAVEIESYRPFFILGEVAAPGQYPYVPNMSVESAVAIAGGFSPRARRDRVTLTHTDSSGSMRFVVPLGTSLSPGDTVLVGERWF